MYQSNYVAETRTFGQTVKVSVVESCHLTGTTDANCEATIAIGVDGISTLSRRQYPSLAPTSMSTTSLLPAAQELVAGS